MENSSPLTSFPPYLVDGLECDVHSLRLVLTQGKGRFPAITAALIENIKRTADLLHACLQAKEPLLLTEKIQQDAECINAVKSNS